MTVLAIREAKGLRELLHDATEFMLGWDCIAPLKAQLGQPFRELEARLQAAVDARYQLPPWTAQDYAKHKQADRLAAASEAFHVVGWSRTDMVKALGVEIHPLLDDPLPQNGFARWEPWPPRATQHLFMERFRELAHASQSGMSPYPNARVGTRCGPIGYAILTTSILQFSLHKHDSHNIDYGTISICYTISMVTEIALQSTSSGTVRAKRPRAGSEAKTCRSAASSFDRQHRRQQCTESGMVALSRASAVEHRASVANVVALTLQAL